MGTIVDPSEVWLELGLSASITEEERAVVEQSIMKAEGAIKRYLRYDPVQRRRTEYYPLVERFDGNLPSVWEVTGGVAYARSLATGASSELQLTHLFVRSAPAMEVRIDYNGRAGTVAGSFADETIQVEGTDFWMNYEQLDEDGNRVCLDGILRSGGLWPDSPGSVLVVYTAGLTAEELRGRNAGGNVIDASPIWAAALEESKRRVEQIMVRKKSVFGWAAGPKSSESLGDYSYSIDSSLAKELYGNKAELTDETMQMLSSFRHMGIDV